LFSPQAVFKLLYSTTRTEGAAQPSMDAQRNQDTLLGRLGEEHLVKTAGELKRSSDELR